MDSCSHYAKTELDELLTDVIYGKKNHKSAFDNILYTHPAVYTVGYSLTQTLAESGVTSIYDSRPELFSFAFLAGVNLSECFFVSGGESDLVILKETLDKEHIISVLLPVRFTFHSSKIDCVRNEFLAYASTIQVSYPSCPVYSSALARIQEVSVKKKSEINIYLEL